MYHDFSILIWSDLTAQCGDLLLLLGVLPKKLDVGEGWERDSRNKITTAVRNQHEEHYSSPAEVDTLLLHDFEGIDQMLGLGLVVATPIADLGELSPLYGDVTGHDDRTACRYGRMVEGRVMVAIYLSYVGIEVPVSQEDEVLPCTGYGGQPQSCTPRRGSHDLAELPALNDHLILPQVSFLNVVNLVSTDGTRILSRKGEEVFFVTALPFTMEAHSLEMLGIRASEVGLRPALAVERFQGCPAIFEKTEFLDVLPQHLPPELTGRLRLAAREEVGAEFRVLSEAEHPCHQRFFGLVLRRSRTQCVEFLDPGLALTVDVEEDGRLDVAVPFYRRPGLGTLVQLYGRELPVVRQTLVDRPETVLVSGPPSLKGTRSRRRDQLPPLHIRDSIELHHLPPSAPPFVHQPEFKNAHLLRPPFPPSGPGP